MSYWTLVLYVASYTYTVLEQQLLHTMESVMQNVYNCVHAYEERRIHNNIFTFICHKHGGVEVHCLRQAQNGLAYIILLPRH